ncbi:MAG TPA: substrate-binding domain-containing protein [Chthoniobacteraceae bacterium]|nr:substrate-binding domain-containing protein [Chthoniobacteraceae bacterium]
MLPRFFLFLSAIAAQVHADVVRVKGSATMGQALQAAAPAIKEQTGADLRFETLGGSTPALLAAIDGSADLAMVTREIRQEDRAESPKRPLFDLEIGVQILVPVVSRETWDAGVKSINKEEFVAMYEGDITNWNKLGGGDRAVKFYNPEPGQGVWELFVTWLYGDVRKAPLGKRWEKVGTHQLARDSVEFNLGSISIAPPRWADGKRVIALPIRNADGTELLPTAETFHSHKWPMTRPLLLVTAGKPTGSVRKVMEVMVQVPGQEALTKVDFIPDPGAATRFAEMLRK